MVQKEASIDLYRKKKKIISSGSWDWEGLDWNLHSRGKTKSYCRGNPVKFGQALKFGHYYYLNHCDSLTRAIDY